MIGFENSDRGARKLRISLPITVRQFARLAEKQPFRVIAELNKVRGFAAMNTDLEESDVRYLAERFRLEVEFVSKPPS